jgi:hypothetical protein
MTLGRLEIRGRIRDRLLAADTGAGDRVYTTRKRAHWKSKLPALVVYTVEETDPSYLAVGLSPIWERPLIVAVEVVVDDREGPPDDEVDILCHQVEHAVLAGERFLGLARVRDVRLGPTQFRWDARGDREQGAARVLFYVPYTHELDADPALLAPWILAHTEWDVAPADGTAEAVDDQALEQ